MTTVPIGRRQAPAAARRPEAAVFNEHLEKTPMHDELRHAARENLERHIEAHEHEPLRSDLTRARGWGTEEHDRRSLLRA